MRRRLGVIVLSLFLASVPVCLRAQVAPGPHGEGDLDYNGIIQPIDELILINYLNGVGEFTPDQFLRADNAPSQSVEGEICPEGDGIIQPADVLVIHNILIGGDVFSPLNDCPYDFDMDGYIDALSPDGDDCDDVDTAVNPGANEGPYGDPTCGDGIDNDCDGIVDTDPECVGWGCFLGIVM